MTGPLILASTPPQLTEWRKRHVIVVDSSGPEPVCAHCRIRVFERRSGARPKLWRHDPDAITRLARIERGEAPDGQ